MYAVINIRDSMQRLRPVQIAEFNGGEHGKYLEYLSLESPAILAPSSVHSC